jgi:hypothetical protein
MKLLKISSGIKTTYEVHMKYSLLWECALGIAASTYDELHHTFEKSTEYWRYIIKKLSPEAQIELEYSKRHNTWKSLLQLLQMKDFPDLISFLDYIKDLKEDDLRFSLLPFLGKQNESNRRDSSLGDKIAKIQLIETCLNHKFYPEYIEFICSIQVDILKNHLITIMNAWYETVIKPDEAYTLSILKRDFQSKISMKEKLTPEKFVEWVIGEAYTTESSVTDVLLIPQYIYRPWTVESDDINTRIFFYPISDKNIVNSEDVYIPSFTLVQEYKSLGDEIRLKIVKLLYEGDKSLQELTSNLGFAKSTVHHHLSLLRSARLVQIVDSMYHLNKDILFIIESDLKAYLEK